MISKLLLALTKESSDGYFINQSSLPLDLQELVKKPSYPTDTSTAEEIQKPSKNEAGFPLYEPTIRIEKDLSEADSIDLSSLLSRIRPQQSIAFAALCETLAKTTSETIKQASALIVDLPLKTESGYQWVRCQVPFDESKVKTYPLDAAKLWMGQPLFPRLLMDNKPVLLPNAIKKDIYQAFLKRLDFEKCPLHKMPRLMLRIAYTKPDLRYAQIVEYTQKGKTLDGESYSLTYEAVEKNFKNLGKVGKESFGVKFSPIKHLGNYWEEMGFDVVPIPELA